MILIASIAQQGAGGPTPVVGSIQYVGGKTLGDGAGTGITFDFTGLTGGIASTPSVGDLFILAAAGADNGTPVLALGTEPTGLIGLYASEDDQDTIDHSQAVWHGFYEAGSASGGHLNGSGSSSPRVLNIMVFRGAELSSTVTPTTTERNNGTTITPASITPVSVGSWPFVSVAAGHNNGTQFWDDPETYAHLVNGAQADLEDISLFNGAETGWESGSYAPAEMTHPSGGDRFAASTALTMVIEPSLSSVKAQASFDTTNGRLAVPDESSNDSFFVFRGDTVISSAQANLGTTSCRFDGATDLIDIYAPEATPEDLHFAVASVPATIEFWFRSDDASQTDTLYSSNDNTFEDDIKIGTVGGELSVQLWNAASAVLTITGGTLSSETWHHVACVWDGADMTVYLDGTSIGSGTPSSAPSFNNSPKTLGYDRQDTSESFAGYIEGFRFSKAEVYTGNFTPPTSHFEPKRTKAAAPNPTFSNVAHLAGWEGTNGDETYTDESTSAPTLSFSGGANIDSAQARFGATSLYLDGTNEYVTIANSTDVSIASQTQHTIEAWVRPAADALSKTSSIFNKQAGSSAQEYRFTIRGDGAGGNLDFFTFSSGNTRAAAITRANVVQADTWSHVVAVRDGNRYMIFVDGELEATDYTASAPSSNSQGPRIGSSAFNSGRDWEGFIDETRITNEVFYRTIGFTPPAAAFPRS